MLRLVPIPAPPPGVHEARLLLLSWPLLMYALVYGILYALVYVLAR